MGPFGTWDTTEMENGSTVNATALTGWTITTATVRRIGKFVFFNLGATNNATKSFSATDGQIADQDVMTIPAGYRPSVLFRTLGVWDGRMCYVYIGAAGTVTIGAVDGYGSSSYSYAAGAAFATNGVYVIP